MIVWSFGRARGCRQERNVVIRGHSDGIVTCAGRHQACLGSGTAIVNNTPRSENKPEIEVVDRALLVSHINVEGEKIDGRERPPAKNLEQGRESISIKVGLGRGRVCYGFRHFDGR